MQRESEQVRIRPRSQGDIATLVHLADAVRAVDRWPPHRCGTTRHFIAGTVPLLALVADDHGLAIGHVALHERSAPEVIVIALASDALNIGPDQLAVVARLFVEPGRRRQGVGRALLNAAVEAAAGLGRHLILDVWAELDDAIALYERGGWRRLGEVSFAFTSSCGPECLHAGNSLRSVVYSAPRSDGS
jgi:GNAT superfamily N-acetyltransferase